MNHCLARIFAWNLFIKITQCLRISTVLLNIISWYWSVNCPSSAQCSLRFLFLSNRIVTNYIVFWCAFLTNMFGKSVLFCFFFISVQFNPQSCHTVDYCCCCCCCCCHYCCCLHHQTKPAVWRQHQVTKITFNPILMFDMSITRGSWAINIWYYASLEVFLPDLAKPSSPQ